MINKAILVKCVFIAISLLHTHVIIAQESKSPKVILISVDGAADWILDDLLRRKVLPKDGAFAQMKTKGAYAERMIPVGISATAVSHISLFTGTHPNKHGIVGNNILLQGDTIKSPRATSGFIAPIKAETIWKAATRQGKKVININTVGQDNKNTNRQGTYTLGYGKRIARSSVSKLAPIPEGNFKTKKYEHVKSLKPANFLGYKLISGKELTVNCFAVDTSFDDIENYDAILLDFDKDISNGYLGELKPNTWSEIQFDVQNQKVSSWSYLADFDHKSATANVYLGAIGYNPSGPEEFKTRMETEVGIWPCEQDNIKLSQGLITEKMWLDQAERLALFYQKLILANLHQDNWDLLSGYFTLIDDVQHRFLLKDKRQLDYNLENGARKKRYDQYVKWAYKTIDTLLLELIQNAPKDTNFLIVSDHGVAPIHSIVLANNVLEEAGITVQGKNIEARAYSTGPAAHIYINLKDRQGQGVVSKEEFTQYVDTIVKIFKNLKDKKTGVSIFPIVLKSSELDHLHLDDNSRAGDVFISARTGWSISSKIRPKVPGIVPNSFNQDAYAHLDIETQHFLASGFMNETGLGVHGNPGNQREMNSIFYAIGPNIKNKNVGQIHSLDIVPTIADLLEIIPPDKAKGKSVF